MISTATQASYPTPIDTTRSNLTSNTQRGFNILPPAHLVVCSPPHYGAVADRQMNSFREIQTVAIPALEPGLDLLAQTATHSLARRYSYSSSQSHVQPTTHIEQQVGHIRSISGPEDVNRPNSKTVAPHQAYGIHDGDEKSTYSSSSTWKQKHVIDTTRRYTGLEINLNRARSRVENMDRNPHFLRSPDSPLSLNYPGVRRIDARLPGVPKTRKRRREIPEKKGPWTEGEDAVLMQLVAKFGPRKWREIARSIEGRTGKQARERWMNQLSPQLKKDVKWTDMEDRVVVLRQAEFGNRWSMIAQSVPGRTDNHVKNRFNSTLKRKKDEGFFDGWLQANGWARRETFYPYTSMLPPPRPRIEQNDMVRIAVALSAKCHPPDSVWVRHNGTEAASQSPYQKSMRMNTDGEHEVTLRSGNKSASVSKRISVGSLCNF